ncbi:MAG: hypothetical protein WCN98_16585 [Verrucomicrobiaceae bacterium]
MDDQIHPAHANNATGAPMKMLPANILSVVDRTRLITSTNSGTAATEAIHVTHKRSGDGGGFEKEDIVGLGDLGTGIHAAQRVGGRAEEQD